MWFYVQLRATNEDYTRAMEIESPEVQIWRSIREGQDPKSGNEWDGESMAAPEGKWSGTTRDDAEHSPTRQQHRDGVRENHPLGPEFGVQNPANAGFDLNNTEHQLSRSQ